LAELALAEEQRCREAATQTAMSAESSLANERCCHKAAAQAVESTELVLAKKQRRHETTVWEKVLANDACEQCCQELAECTAALAKLPLAAEQTMVSADSALPEPALAEDKQRQEETPKNSAIQTTSALWHRYCHPTPLMWQSGAFRWNALSLLLLSMPSWPRLNTTTLQTRHELC
jgi:hypothetical protein